MGAYTGGFGFLLVMSAHNMPANSIIANPPMTTPMIAPVLRTGDFPLEAVGVWELELEPVPELIPDEDEEPVG